MKVGDLVKLRDGTFGLVVKITKTKKPWHRRITCVSEGIFFTVPWAARAEFFDIISTSKI